MGKETKPGGEQSENGAERIREIVPVNGYKDWEHMRADEVEGVATGELPIWAVPWLKRFEDMPTVRTACEYAGINRVTYYSWIKRSPAFRELVRAARASAIDRLEENALERAMSGQASDPLLMFMLKNLRPETYSEKISVEVGGAESLLGLGSGRKGFEGASELSEGDRVERITELLERVASRMDRGKTIDEDGNEVDRVIDEDAPEGVWREEDVGRAGGEAGEAAEGAGAERAGQGGAGA